MSVACERAGGDLRGQGRDVTSRQTVTAITTASSSSGAIQMW
jgi:hypothetical protein